MKSARRAKSAGDSGHLEIFLAQYRMTAVMSETYFDQTMRRMRVQMDASSIFLGLVTEAYLADPMCWAQMGYAVLKDKPIALLVRSGTRVPENLRRVARAIEEFGADEDIELAGQRLLTKLDTLRL